MAGPFTISLSTCLTLHVWQTCVQQCCPESIWQQEWLLNMSTVTVVIAVFATRLNQPSSGRNQTPCLVDMPSVGAVAVVDALSI